MFSGSVARGSGQPLSQMNDHQRVWGNPGAVQNSAYDLLRACLCRFKIKALSLSAYSLYLFPSFLCFMIKFPNAQTDCQKERTKHKIGCGSQKFIDEVTNIQKQERRYDHRESPCRKHQNSAEFIELFQLCLWFFCRHGCVLFLYFIETSLRTLLSKGALTNISV